MRRRDEARAKARRLREQQGWSLERIAHEVGAAKSSVSLWVRDVVPLANRKPPRPPGAADLRGRRLPVWSSNATRTCSRCRCTLPLELFNRAGTGRQWWCRRCFAAYFRERGDVHRRQSDASRRRRREAARRLVLEHLARHPCAGCGEAEAVVLEFDHVRGKTAIVSLITEAGVSLTRLADEIARCDVVCVNCHRRRTARRAGWRRLTSGWHADAPPRRPTVARNVALAYSVLESRGCVDCGTRDLVTLEFDHVREKRAGVMKLAWSGCGVSRLLEEMAACEVRCGNCHRRRTAQRGDHYRLSAGASAVSSDSPL